MKLTDQNKTDIKNAIKKAEQKTSGEIIPVILSASDLYPGAHFRAALLGGFLASVLTYLSYDFNDPIALLWAQIPGMLLGYLLAFFSPIKRLLSLKSEFEEEAYQRAIQIYFENRVSSTKDRTGILIFISLLERKVHILSDHGINQVVGAGFWNQTVANLILKIKSKQIASGLIEAILSCGEKLEHNFPIQENDSNELFDDLITDL